MLNFVINADILYLMNNTLIVVVGPTAIGKTNLSIKLANHYNCEIVSADSRQFYKEMYIGTAVPSKSELQQASHHFIQHKSIKDSFSVGDFEKEAIIKLQTLFQNNNYAILVGGSGLYVDAVTKGLDEFPDVDTTIRADIKKIYDNDGIEPLQQQLKTLDPIYYNKVDIHNTHRIEIIYNRINQRVDNMIDAGLLVEVKKLHPYKTLNALNTVGYKEIFKYLEGINTLDVAISEIKKNTRRFAKRQLTWFRKDTSIHWFDYQTSIETVTSYIKKSL